MQNSSQVAGAFSSRQCRFLRWTARLLFFALAIQTAAIDHWRLDPAQVRGLEGSQRHEMHCHGSLSDCGDGGAAGLASVVPSPAQLPQVSEPPAHLFGQLRTEPHPDDALIVTDLQPPRSTDSTV